MAREKAEKERQEREARKRALIDMNPSETQEGVMDRYIREETLGVQDLIVLFQLIGSSADWQRLQQGTEEKTWR